MAALLLAGLTDGLTVSDAGCFQADLHAELNVNCCVIVDMRDDFISAGYGN